MKRNFELAAPFFYDRLKSYARENRRNQTEAEEFLWRQLSRNALGVKFKRQLIILNYIVDFACLEKSLIIEVDGGYHFTEEQMELDAYRTEDLERLGFKVLRFKNENIIIEIEQVLKTIQDYINGHTN